MKKFKDYQLKLIENIHLTKIRKRKINSYRKYYRKSSKYSIWDYIRFTLEKNIGENVDKVFSKIIAWKKINCKNNYYIDIIQSIADYFDNHPNSSNRDYGIGAWRRNYTYSFKYTVDSQRRIQYTKEYLNFKRKPIHKKYTIVQTHQDIKFLGYHMFSSKIITITNKNYSSLFKKLMEKHFESPHDHTIYLNTKDSYCKSWLFSSFEVIFKKTYLNVSKKRFLQVSKENNQKVKLKAIEKRKALKIKQYSMLSKEEMRIKKEKEDDKIKLLKHGFDEESFKCEPYHGQKRKKKCIKLFPEDKPEQIK